MLLLLLLSMISPLNQLETLRGTRGHIAPAAGHPVAIRAREKSVKIWHCCGKQPGSVKWGFF